MGVGAIFISTLALRQLPPPSSNTPQTQQDILALSIHPIVSFVVLSSIIVRASAVNNSFLPFNLHILLDGLSIPFFNLGQNFCCTVSSTATLTPPSPRSRNQPDWVLYINRIIPVLQKSISEVPDVAVLHSTSAGTSTPTIMVSSESQIPDLESGLVVDDQHDDMESLKEVYFP